MYPYITFYCCLVFHYMTVPSVYSFLYWRTVPIYFFISTNKISKTIFIMSVCSHIVAGRETRKVGSPLSSEMSYPGRHVLTKQETSLGRGPGREQRGEGPREDGSAPGSRSRVYGERVHFGLSVAGRSDPGPLLGGALTAQATRIPAGSVLGRHVG